MLTREREIERVEIVEDGEEERELGERAVEEEDEPGRRVLLRRKEVFRLMRKAERGVFALPAMFPAVAVVWAGVVSVVVADWVDR